jgi:hypothetical protein
MQNAECKMQNEVGIHSVEKNCYKHAKNKGLKEKQYSRNI